MKRIILSLAFLSLLACKKEAIETTTEGKDVAVELLFEKDGCKVYRFIDGGRAVYYSDCRGKIEYEIRSSNGKTSTRRQFEILNN